MPIERAAYGAHLIAASNMIRAIKAVSTERGRDPREFALFAFGGNGPLFAAGMAASLGISRVVVPPVGRPVLLVRPALCRRRASLRPHLPPAAAPGRSRRDRQGLGRPGATGERPARRRRLQRRQTPGCSRSAALHYKGQSYELTVPVPDGPIDAAHGHASRGGLRPRSTSAPTAIAPGRTSRSSWSRSSSSAGLARRLRRAAERACRAGAEPAAQASRPRLFRRRRMAGWKRRC